MPDWKLPWRAHCRCERIELLVTVPPMLTMACHCAGCQRLTASAYSLSLAFPRAGVEIVKGEPVLGGLQGPSHHFYCGFCKSWMFTHPAGMDELCNVRATMLDDHGWVAPFVETSTAEGFAWAKTGAAHSFATMPEPGGWAALIADFEVRGPRP